MKKGPYKSIKHALIFASVVLILSIILSLFDLSMKFFQKVGFSIFFAIITGIITYLNSKSIIKNKVRFRWYEWPIYVFGWYVGWANLIFWFIMWLFSEKGRPFFDRSFHKRVYYWGLTILVIIVLIIVVILSAK